MQPSASTDRYQPRLSLICGSNLKSKVDVRERCDPSLQVWPRLRKCSAQTPESPRAGCWRVARLHTSVDTRAACLDIILRLAESTPCSSLGARERYRHRMPGR